jgi:hypothetical protein
VHWTSPGLGVAAAIGLWVLGSIFGLNGHQWAWWRSAAYAESGLVLILASLGSTSRVVPMPRFCPRVVAAGAFVGAALVAVSVAVMARRYSDPYSGALFWPHALALVAFVGLALVAASVVTLSGRWRR